MQRLLLPGCDCAELKEVFGLDDINELPIVYNIAWYEQKPLLSAGAAAPGREEYSPRTYASGIFKPECGKGAGG